MSFILFFKQKNISCVKWCVGNSRLHCLCAHSGPICATKRENNSYFFLFFSLSFSVLPTAYIGVIRGIFIASAFLWIIGSLVSKSKLKIQ